MLKLYNPFITLKDLEYLEENSMMKKAAGIAKGIKDTILGL
ncbi:MAG: YjcQ family protein [Blautia sp.]|nr:YjcQ family protein [Blautia sp.]